jgi:7-dehydrocholesterol reductase
MINDQDIDNIYGPLSLIFIVPLVLFSILIKTNKISNNNLPNKNGLIIFLTLIFYGFLSIKYSDKKFTGPTNVDNVTPEYAANGFEFWIFTVFLTISLSDMFPKMPEIFSKNFIPFIMTANILGLLFVTYLYFRSKDNYYDKEKDDKEKRSELFKFFRGFEHHPKLFGVDIKQWTNCRFGMIAWQIIILLFMFYYFNKNGFNNGIFVTVLLQSIYIGKFFFWETGYFNTLDITLDRAGYYICWGCLVFLPSLYTYSTYYLINQKGDISKKVAIFILLMGIIFTYKNYDVDRQKEIFKKDKEKSIINGKPAKYMDVKYKKDGKDVDSKLLLSGDWGITRHNNYTYEILTSAMWSMPGYKYGIMPFIYLIYIIILLVHRIYRDEDKCSKKYGKYWDEYCKIVRYRLIKGVY